MENQMLFSVLGLILVMVVIAIVRNTLRRRTEGFHVYKRRGGEDGVLFYEEGEKSLQIYFNRFEDIIYIPCASIWKEIMPDWARDRRDEIVERIKERIGKRLIGGSWKFEETESPQKVIPQK
jgi:hypothetical protein